MGLLTRQERERLVQLLLQIPQIYDIEWRRLLTATLPERLRTSIPTAPDALTHVTHMLEIADSDAWVRLPNGDRPIGIGAIAWGLREGECRADRIVQSPRQDQPAGFES